MLSIPFRRPAATALLLLLSTFPYGASASESDPWTYAHIPLADSAAAVNERLAQMLQAVVDAVDSAPAAGLNAVSDTELEFQFFAEFRRRHIRDVTWGLFELCIGTNDCPGWPRFERIQMYPQESVYHAADWRFIPSRFHLASIVQVCGVRMGADKITHFFDDGFHYFNAMRSRRRNLDAEDIRQLSMTFEQTYMGTRMTGILSRADIEANLAGTAFYGDVFGGPSPMIGRDDGGRLVLRRRPDVCDYVSPFFDERRLPNEYTYSILATERAAERAQNLETIIDERMARSANLARQSSGIELGRAKSRLLARHIPMTRWQSDFPKLRLASYGAGMVSQWLFDAEFRRVANLFGFNPLKSRNLTDRKPVTIVRVEVGPAGE
jgi:hypothetical protein